MTLRRTSLSEKKQCNCYEILYACLCSCVHLVDSSAMLVYNAERVADNL